MMPTYEQLLAAAKSNPDAADFAALRLAFADSPDYSPYDRPVEGTASRKELSQALRDKDISRALELIVQQLDSMYLDAELHLLAASLYTERDQPDEATYHKKWFESLIKSLHVARTDEISILQRFEPRGGKTRC